LRQQSSLEGRTAWFEARRWRGELLTMADGGGRDGVALSRQKLSRANRVKVLAGLA